MNEEPIESVEPGERVDVPRVESISDAHLKSIVESLLFVADKPVPAKKLAKLTRSKTQKVEELLAELIEEYRGRGIELVEVGPGFVLRTAARNAPFVRDFVAAKPIRLTRAQLETLAIAAYRQPLTRPELEEIRGVDSGSALKVLLDRGLLRMLGRKDEPGRPLLYGTTPDFLEFFGLRSLKDLPTLREFSELTDESRALFERKTGEPVDLSQVEEAVRAAEAEAEPIDEDDPRWDDPEDGDADVQRAGAASDDEDGASSPALADGSDSNAVDSPEED